MRAMVDASNLIILRSLMTLARSLAGYDNDIMLQTECVLAGRGVGRSVGR